MSVQTSFVGIAFSQMSQQHCHYFPEVRCRTINANISLRMLNINAADYY
jgi:hypothetical protein